jgi:hypothetical protein
LKEIAMKRTLTIGATIAGSVVAGIAAAATGAVVRWNFETARRVARLRVPCAAAAMPYSRDDLEGLPAPVVRYFEYALTPGQPIVRNTRFRQVGEFAMRPGSWKPFTAVQDFSAAPPGFLWDARIRMATAIPVYVRDGYCAGEGAMFGALCALVPVVNERGTPFMASGELLRYLAEAVFFPTALLPRDGISWKPVDENTARVTLVDADTTVFCDVNFGEHGEIVRISAMRAGAPNRKFALTRWVGRFGDYRRVGGMMIPMSGEVEWVLPEGPRPYFRARITDVQYNFAPRETPSVLVSGSDDAHGARSFASSYGSKEHEPHNHEASSPARITVHDVGSSSAR